MSATIAAWCWSSIRVPRRRSSWPAGPTRSGSPRCATRSRSPACPRSRATSPPSGSTTWAARPTGKRPEAGAWADARSAWFVIDSSRAGGMGAAEAVPFGTEPPARAFATAHGGRVVRLDEIPDDYVLGWTPQENAPPARRSAPPAGQRVMSARLGRRRLLIAATAGGLALLAGDARATRATTWRWQGSALGAEFDDAAGSSRPRGSRAGDRRLPRGDRTARADLQPVPGRFRAVAAEPPGLAGSTAARAGRAAGVLGARVGGDRGRLRRHRAAALGSLCRRISPTRPPIRPAQARRRSPPPWHGSTGARSSSTRPGSAFAGPAWR